MAQGVPLPEGIHSVTLDLVVRNAAGAIDFYKSVFGAQEIRRFEKSDGRIWHAELRIGDCVVFLSDELPHSSVRAPSPEAFASTAIRLYVDDVDSTCVKAIGAGARVLRTVSDTFWGDRMGVLADPFGHTWIIATRVRDVSAEEVRRVGAELKRASALQTSGIAGA
jgi:uncharacterized glyoxalase superfamily protein PhnB